MSVSKIKHESGVERGAFLIAEDQSFSESYIKLIKKLIGHTAVDYTGTFE